MFELETNEGEILYFETEDAMIEYVISRMVEKGELNVIGHGEEGHILQLPNSETEL